MIRPDEDATLGILAGGQARRLGGLDKAWLERDGIPQWQRWRALFDGRVAEVLISANHDAGRYLDAGVPVVADRTPGLGPLGGLEALAARCRTGWLFTLPVDLVEIDSTLPSRLAAVVGPDGAFAHDADGVQPLVALWRVAALRTALAAALASGDGSIRGLQRRMRMSVLPLPDIRFGNLNTPADLVSAHVAPRSRA